MGSPIALLRDNFENNTIDPCWVSGVSGSATVAETSGQARLTLPSSTAGSHSAFYRSSGLYDLTGDGFVWNTQTMVATGVAASAFCQLITSDQTQQLYWRQLSGTLTARTIVAGVDSQLFSVSWNASTHKYLRIRESGGTIYWDSSTNGTSWTNRASVANPFAVTDLYVQFAASCGNVASPGSFRLDDVNLVLPTSSATWQETTADWSISNRLRPVTLAATANGEGVVVTADSMDETTRALSGNLRYFAGPIGSASGGYLALTEYASLVLAQASAFPIPVSGRVDLPSFADARYMRLYHRSTDASAHTLREFVPRRMVQAEDIEAESIRAINIAAGAVTADKIYVLSLSAVSASMGALHMDGVIDIDTNGGIYQGTGTFDTPTTGLKIYNASGIGKLGLYSSATEQVTIDSNGLGITGPAFGYGLYNASPVTLPRVNMLQWSKSSGSQAASIVGSSSSQLLMLADKITLAIPLNSSDSYGLNLQANGAHSLTADTFAIGYGGASGPTALTVQTNASNGGSVRVHGSLQTIRSSGSALFAMDGTVSGAGLTIANNATATPFGNTNNFGGLLLVADTTVTGVCAMFLVGASIALVSQSSGSPFTTTSGTASKINVYLNSGVLTIENKNGSSITFNVLGFRARTQA